MIKKILSGLKYLLIGHWTIFKNLFKKRITLEYPEKKVKLNKNFRGKLYQSKNELGEFQCSGCGICKKVCPTKDAIKIEKENNKVVKFEVDLSRCIFCGNCVYNCPIGAIKMSEEYELATGEKSSLKCILIKKENEAENGNS